LADEIATAEASDKFGVWAENWPALLAFLAVDTQWRAVPMGMGGMYWMGLDYTAATAGLAAAGIKVTPALWSDLKVMERAGRDALNGIKG
jgi:hypothetical protein